MSTLKQIARDITSYIGDNADTLTDQKIKRLRVLRCLIADFDNEKCEIWDYIDEDADDIEAVMMDRMDEWCGDLYEQN